MVEYSVPDRAGAGSNPVCKKLCLVFGIVLMDMAREPTEPRSAAQATQPVILRHISVHRRSARKTAPAVAEERRMHKGTNSNQGMRNYNAVLIPIQWGQLLS